MFFRNRAVFWYPVIQPWRASPDGRLVDDPLSLLADGQNTILAGAYSLYFRIA